jgi:hypothetical protein
MVGLSSQLGPSISTLRHWSLAYGPLVILTIVTIGHSVLCFCFPFDPLGIVVGAGDG